ncbi:Chromosome-partitioning ATPase Soj [Sporomusa carbonis]|uniref:ParA family protein n=1 Tax=Sporomusa carbonis TaxID=3076075 RepID=UPI003A603F58
MKIISITNRKGGVGKTVISGNIAYELSKMGYLVVMVDLDSQCELSKIYLHEAYNGGNIFHLLRRQCRLDDACVEVSENLYLIPGSRDIVHFDFRGSEGILLHHLRSELLEEVDFVVIDHPLALSESALAGFVASDEVVIVSDAEAFGVANLGQLLDDLAHIQDVCCKIKMDKVAKENPHFCN